MKFARAWAALKRDPGVVIDRLYYEARGTHPRWLERQLEWERDTNVGAFVALATIAARETDRVHRESLHAAFTAIERTSDARDLARLFAQHGSDKSTKHNYHIAYAGLLSGRRHERLSLLEIGLGTTNTRLRSNMGKDGKPGASLRAFRDWAPAAQVFGADIDQEILFSEDRIDTYYVDQTSTDSLASLAERLPEKNFDLIIDDGLHVPCANLNTLNFALPLLAPDGTFVVEDILSEYLPAWEITAALLKREYNCRLVRGREEWMFLVQKP